MKLNNETKSLIIVAAIKATRPLFKEIPSVVTKQLVDAGYTIKESKTGYASIGQGTAHYRPGDAFGVLMGLRSVDQRSVDGWAVPNLKIENKPARVKDVLNLGRRVGITVSWK